jgi:hypothetical protein
MRTASSWPRWECSSAEAGDRLERNAHLRASRLSPASLVCRRGRPSSWQSNFTAWRAESVALGSLPPMRTQRQAASSACDSSRSAHAALN